MDIMNNKAKKGKRLSIVVPAFNEEDLIEHALDSLSEVVKNCIGCPFEIIFVDDGSHDNTWHRCQKPISIF